MSLSTNIKGNPHVQGNVQVYNVRISVRGCIKRVLRGLVPFDELVASFWKKRPKLLGAEVPVSFVPDPP